MKATHGHRHAIYHRSTLTELRHALGLLKNNSCIIGIDGASWIAPKLYCGVGPDGNARTAVATRLVAHDVAPFHSVDVSVAVSEWSHVPIQRFVVPCTDDVADLVRKRIGQGCTGLMDDDIGLVGVGAHARG